jgi:hypothetical protein
MVSGFPPRHLSAADPLCPLQEERRFGIKIRHIDQPNTYVGHRTDLFGFTGYSVFQVYEGTRHG